MYIMTKEKQLEKLEAAKAALPEACGTFPCDSCPHRSECSTKATCLDDMAREHFKYDRYPETLTSKQANDIEKGLVAGLSLRRLASGNTKFAATFVANVSKVKKHMEAYPAWGERMRVMAQKNAKDADRLKGNGKRRKNGLCAKGHSMDEHGAIYIRGGKEAMYCRACQTEQRKIGVMPSIQRVGLAMAAMMMRTPIKDFTGGGSAGYIMSHANFNHCRRAIPQFDTLAEQTIAWCRANPRPSAALIEYRRRKEEAALERLEAREAERQRKRDIKEAQRVAVFQVKQAKRSERERKIAEARHAAMEAAIKEREARAEDRARRDRLKAVSNRSNLRGASTALTGTIAGPSDPIFDACIAAVPNSLSRTRRLEVIASLALAVVDKQITIENVEKKVDEYLRNYKRTYESPYGTVSLDAPAFHDSSVPRIETIPSDIPLWERRA